MTDQEKADHEEFEYELHPIETEVQYPSDLSRLVPKYTPSLADSCRSSILILI